MEQNKNKTPIQWCEQKKNEAAEKADFISWQNYTDMKKLWESRLPQEAAGNVS